MCVCIYMYVCKCIFCDTLRMSKQMFPYWSNLDGNCIYVHMSGKPDVYIHTCVCVYTYICKYIIYGTLRMSKQMFPY